MMMRLMMTRMFTDNNEANEVNDKKMMTGDDKVNDDETKDW